MVKLRDSSNESNERDILIERANMWLEKKLMLGKFPEIHKDDPH